MARTEPTAIRTDARRDCIVCGRRAVYFFRKVEDRDYRHCTGCGAVFLDPDQRLSATETHAHYREHRNDPADPDYRRFLSRLADPLMARLGPARDGLEFGCGPGPALAQMLREAGHRVRLFDLYFHPDRRPLKHRYDFITCTETIEHFHRPAEEFMRFDRLLRPGGWLGLMTRFLTDQDHFATWYYRRDPTHVVFYREGTLRRIAEDRGWECDIPAQNVALMRKPPDPINPPRTPSSCSAGRGG